MLSLVFCALARPEPSQVNFTKIFGKTPAAELKVNFGGPAGGSALERASPPRGKIETWLVQTYKKYFIDITPGQIVAKMLGGFSKRIPQK